MEVSIEYEENMDDCNTGCRRGDSMLASAAVLRRGWNLVGKGFTGELPDRLSIWTVEDGAMTLVKKTMDGYDLQPGKGYWIFMP